MDKVDVMSERKALALAIVALDEVARRQGGGATAGEWYLARRTIKSLLDKFRAGEGKQIVSP